MGCEKLIAVDESADIKNLSQDDLKENKKDVESTENKSLVGPETECKIVNKVENEKKDIESIYTKSLAEVDSGYIQVNENNRKTWETTVENDKDSSFTKSSIGLENDDDKCIIHEINNKGDKYIEEKSTTDLESGNKKDEKGKTNIKKALDSPTRVETDDKTDGNDKNKEKKIESSANRCETGPKSDVGKDNTNENSRNYVDSSVNKNLKIHEADDN